MPDLLSMKERSSGRRGAAAPSLPEQYARHRKSYGSPSRQAPAIGPR